MNYPLSPRIIAASLVASLLFWLASPGRADTRITLSITVTNLPADADLLTVQSDARTNKTAVTLPSKEILIGASIGQQTTNLWNQITGYPIASLIPQWIATNQVNLIAPVGTAISASSSGTWCTLALSTQTVTTVTAMNLEQTQVASGAKTFLSITTSNLVNKGSAVSSQGSGTDSEQFGTGAVATNINSLAVGQAAISYAANGAALGNNATVTAGADNGTALGNFTTVTGGNGLAAGNSASASATNAVAVGSASSASAARAMALGTLADASFADSIAIGTSSAATATKQIRMGDATYDVSVPGTLTAAAVTNSTYYGTIGSLANGTVSGSTLTNVTIHGTIGTLSAGVLNGVGQTNNTSTNGIFRGTQTFTSQLLHTRVNNTSLANGNNAGIDFGAETVFVKIKAGPTGAFAICGISGGANGRLLKLYNATGQNMTLANESGVDATPANRIVTMTGADVAGTGNSAAELIYDTDSSRWILINHEP